MDILLDAAPHIRSRVKILDWQGKQVPWRGQNLPIPDLKFEPLSERFATDNGRRAAHLFDWWWQLNASMVFNTLHATYSRCSVRTYSRHQGKYKVSSTST